MSWPPLLVRADTGAQVGAGHLMRCLALAEQWSGSGGDVAVAVNELSPARSHAVLVAGAALHTIAAPRATAEDAAETARLGRDLGAAWIIADGYPFGPWFQTLLRKEGARLLVVDDHGSHGRYDANLVLDQNLGAQADDYDRRSADAALLLGSRYALLRREFTATTGAAVEAGKRQRVVVALGGDSGTRVKTLAARLGTRLGEGVDVVTPAGVGSSGAMGILLRSATVAVSAAGTTAWELSSLGVPSVLVSVADNQEPVGAALDHGGAAIYLGPLDEVTPDDLSAIVAQLVANPARRASMAARGRALIDGRGAARVTTRLRAPLVSLRPVVAADARLLWEWANDPVVRAQSFSSGPIGWEDHVDWIERRLAEPSCFMYLAGGAEGPWGQIRFEALDSATAEVGVSIATHERGRHRAAPLIRAGVERLFRETAFTRVRARVKHDNEASRAAFLAADFDECDEQAADGHRTLCYTHDQGTWR